MLPLTKRLLYKWYIMQNVRKIGLFGNTFKCLIFQLIHMFFLALESYYGKKDFYILLTILSGTTLFMAEQFSSAPPLIAPPQAATMAG